MVAFAECKVLLLSVNSAMLPIKSTYQGFGTCPGYHEKYSSRWKSTSCSSCSFHLGGTVQTKAKKQKPSISAAVLLKLVIR